MKSKAATNWNAKKNKARGVSSSSSVSPILVPSRSSSASRAQQTDLVWSAGAASSNNRTPNAATSPPQQGAPSWARYIDSRLKQFSLR